MPTAFLISHKNKDNIKIIKTKFSKISWVICAANPSCPSHKTYQNLKVRKRHWPNYTKYEDNTKASRALLQYQDNIKKTKKIKTGHHERTSGNFENGAKIIETQRILFHFTTIFYYYFLTFHTVEQQ